MINQYSLKFNDTQVENDFNHWFFNEELQTFRYVLLLGIFIYVIFIPLDIILFNDKDLIKILILRLGTILFIILMYFFAFKFLTKPKQYQFLAITVAFTCFQINIISTFLSQTNDFYLNTGNTILIIFVFSLLNIRFTYIKRLALYFAIAHLFILNYNFNLSIDIFIQQAYGIIAVILIGLLSNYIIEFQKRQNYLNQRIIQEQKTTVIDSNRQKDKLLKILKEQNIELDAFNHSVTHDLKTPLRSINSFSKLVERRYKDSLDKNGKEYIQFIISGTNKMNTLINDLLAYSKIRKVDLNIETVDMNTLVENTYLDQIKDIENKPVLIKTHLPNVKGDSVLLKQVWQNLISNAIKYSSKNEEIIINISATQTNKEVLFSIKDNGIGFDMKHAKKLFEIFKRLHTENEFTGTGVGLSLVHRIIEKHNGKIWAESEPNKGSIFYFTLPL